MNEIIKNNWEKSLEAIKKSISFQAFQTWFNDIQLVSGDDSQITLQVPNRFHYEWIDSKYGELIKSSVSKNFGNKSLKINFSIIMKDAVEAAPVNNVDKLIPASFHRASQLNRRYIFSNFIEGKGNQFAKAAASSVAD